MGYVNSLDGYVWWEFLRDSPSLLHDSTGCPTHLPIFETCKKHKLIGFILLLLGIHLLGGWCVCWMHRVWLLRINSNNERMWQNINIRSEVVCFFWLRLSYMKCLGYSYRWWFQRVVMLYWGKWCKLKGICFKRIQTRLNHQVVEERGYTWNQWRLYFFASRRSEMAIGPDYNLGRNLHGECHPPR